MRIAIVNERWTAGATRCARDLQRGLAARHTVQYFPEERKLTATEQMQLLAEFRPDVVHLHSFYGDLPYTFFAEVANRYPTVFTPHDPRPVGDALLKCWNCTEYRTCFRCPMVGSLKRYSLVKHQYYWSRREKRRVHASLPASTVFVGVSDWMKHRMEHSELSRFRIERIHNGVDLQRFSRQPGLRRDLGISDDAQVLLFAAHHAGWTADERKGGHVLARALAEIVIPRYPDVIVLAVGGGMVPNLPNVRPLGFIKPEDIARYYSIADIFVAPSLADNLPYTVLEAMGCGIPVVASRVGGIPEEIDDGRTSRLFSVGSAEELGSTLLDLLANPQLCRDMGAAGRKRAEEMFGMEVFVRQHEDLYQSVVASPGASSNAR